MANIEPPKSQAVYDENFTNENLGACEENFTNENNDWVWTDNDYLDQVYGYDNTKRPKHSDYLTDLEELNAGSCAYNYNENLADYESYLEDFKNGEGLKSDGNGHPDQSFLRKCSGDSYSDIKLDLELDREKERSQNGEPGFDQGHKTPELIKTNSENPYTIKVLSSETLAIGSPNARRKSVSFSAGKLSEVVDIILPTEKLNFPSSPSPLDKKKNSVTNSNKKPLTPQPRHVKMNQFKNSLPTLVLTPLEPDVQNPANLQAGFFNTLHPQSRNLTPQRLNSRPTTPGIATNFFNGGRGRINSSSISNSDFPFEKETDPTNRKVQTPKLTRKNSMRKSPVIDPRSRYDIITFDVENYIQDINNEETYDIVICFSVTKWIH